MQVGESSDLCPYCGVELPADIERCTSCTGMLDDYNRRVVQQHFGPWYVRLPAMAFRPGCSYSVLKSLVQRGTVDATTVVRGPTTRQFWAYAKDVPGVAHLLGICHACGQYVRSTDASCPHCSREFPTPDHRNYLGLDPDNHRLLNDAIRRERGEPTQSELQEAQHQQREAGSAQPRAQSGERSPQPVGAQEFNPFGQGGTASGGDNLFELASAAAGPKRAPRQNPVPRTNERGGQFLKTLIIVNAVLVVLLILVVVIVMLRSRTGGGPLTLPSPVSMVPPDHAATSDEPPPIATDRSAWVAPRTRLCENRATA